MLLSAATQSEVWHSVADALVLLAAALLCGTLAERLRQSAIVGYLAAGVLVGPNLLGWIANQQDIFNLAELGVALLLFTIGLELRFPDCSSLAVSPCSAA
ncbi:MAG: cation:proton antiporter [Planctomycetaceae bacterium]